MDLMSLPGAREMAPTEWDAAQDRLVDDLRQLIRIPSINPPDPPGSDGELRAANWIAGALTDAGLRPEVVEPFPGRGSVAARLRGDGTGGEPLLLLSHLDVVPAPAEEWTHDPFGGDLDDGYVWGRGAVDMKDLLAMELGRAAACSPREDARAGPRPGHAIPIPGLRRDVLFASTADEEAGGRRQGRLGRRQPPRMGPGSGGVNEAGGVRGPRSADSALLSDPGRREGLLGYRLTVRGTWGHGSMPRPDNAAVLAARVIDRLAETRAPSALTPRWSASST